MTTLFENNCEHLESVPFETLINSLLLTIPSVKDSSVESIRQREIITAILTRTSVVLSQADSYRKDLLIFSLKRKPSSYKAEEVDFLFKLFC